MADTATSVEEKDGRNRLEDMVAWSTGSTSQRDLVSRSGIQLSGDKTCEAFVVVQ